MSPSLFGLPARWMLFAALTLMVGAVAFRQIVVRGVRRSSPDPARCFSLSAERIAAMIGRWGTILLLPALVVVLAVQAAEFRDPFDPFWPQLSTLILHTLWGRTWLIQVGLAAVAFVAFTGTAKTNGSGWWHLATITALAAGISPAFTGHSFATEHLRGLAMAADAVHLLAAGAWLGGLLVLASTCGGALRSSTAGHDYIPRSVTAFSPLALGAVTTLILTGTFAAWLHVGSLSQLWASPYGRVLTAKLLLVGVMALLGAYNWKRVTPRLGDPDGQSEFVRRSARAELVVGVLILAATALVVASPMPMEG